MGKIISKFTKGIIRSICRKDRNVRRVISGGKKLCFYFGLFLGGGLLTCILYSLFRTKKK